MGDFVELGLEGFNKLTDVHFDRTWDAAAKGGGLFKGKKSKNKDTGREKNVNDRDDRDNRNDRNDRNDLGNRGNRDDRGDMSGYDQRYQSQPPLHRGYADDGYNSYDDEPPQRLRENRASDRDRYDPSDWRPQETYRPRYQDAPSRQQRYIDDGPAQHPSSPREYEEGGELAPYHRRREDSRPRRRRRHSPSRSRSREGSRDRDDSRSRLEKYSDNPMLMFDKSERGLGVGLAGAVVGGLVARELGDHKKRNTAVGAVIGGLAANIAENGWKIYREEKREEDRGMAQRWEQRQQNGGDGGGRSRRRSR